jgi:Uma2 family endonuclease
MTIAPEVWPPHLLMRNISWQTYQQLVKDLGEQNLRLTYDKGNLEIMSPLPEHERAKTFIGDMFRLLSFELDIPIASLGSTTFKRKSLKLGLEPDECYYIRRERAVRGKKRLDLQRDPPPDLVVEVDLTYRTVDKQRIYAAMRVPEIWNYDAGRLHCLHLKRGKYEASETSLAIPFFKPAVMERFLRMLNDTDETKTLRAWRDWVRKNLPVKE